MSAALQADDQEEELLPDSNNSYCVALGDSVLFNDSNNSDMVEVLAGHCWCSKCTFGAEHSRELQIFWGCLTFGSIDLT